MYNSNSRIKYYKQQVLVEQEYMQSIVRREIISDQMNCTFVLKRFLGSIGLNLDVGYTVEYSRAAIVI